MFNFARLTTLENFKDPENVLTNKKPELFGSGLGFDYWLLLGSNNDSKTWHRAIIQRAKDLFSLEARITNLCVFVHHFYLHHYLSGLRN